MNNIFDIAVNIATPLALAGLLCAAFFLILKQIINKNLFPILTKQLSSKIIIIVINRLFILSLIAMILGFIGYILPMIIEINKNGNTENSSKKSSCYAKVEIYEKNTKKYTPSRLYLQVTGSGKTNQFPFSSSGISQISLSNNQMKDWTLVLINYDGIVYKSVSLKGCPNEKKEIKIDKNSKIILSPK